MTTPQIDDWIIFGKTQLGNDEILRRSVGLPTDLRSLLLLIDGRRDLAMLRNVSQAVRETSAPLLYLEDNGFIMRTGVNEMRLSQLSQGQPGSTVVEMNPRRTLLSEINQSHLSAQASVRPNAPAVAQQAAPLPGAMLAAAQAQLAQMQYQPATQQPQYQPVAQPQYAQNPQQFQPPIPQAQPPMPMQGAAEFAALNDVKSTMIQFISAALGADGNHAIGRIQSAPNLTELQTIARKLYDVLKSYAGVKSAESFMQRFEVPLKLR
jgi:hypothetical protein